MLLGQALQLDQCSLEPLAARKVRASVSVVRGIEMKMKMKMKKALESGRAEPESNRKIHTVASEEGNGENADGGVVPRD